MLTAALKTLMADVVTMYFMAHGFHWNVEGADFKQYHDLFSDIYEDVYDSLDPLAENIRKLGEYAPFDLEAFIKTRTVKFESTKPNTASMSKALLRVNDGVIDSIKKAFDAATAADEQGIADFLAGRDDMHKKWRWFLTSATK